MVLNLRINARCFCGRFAQHLSVDIDRLLIIKPSIICGVDRGRQISLHVEQRVNHALAIADDTDVEVALPKRGEPRAGLQHPLRYKQPDLAPIVDDSIGIVFIGLVDIAVQELETEPFRIRLFQQSLGGDLRFWSRCMRPNGRGTPPSVQAEAACTARLQSDSAGEKRSPTAG